MNINQIRYVLEVAGSTSMREAASKLFISQPALSTSIRELEEELGILIFERTNKGISLTSEGHEFITYGQKALMQYELLESRYLSSNKDKARFSVSTQHFTFAIKAFSDVIKMLSPEKYCFSIHETKTKDVLENVKDLKSEVGIISYSSTNMKIIKKLIKEYQLEFVPLMKRDTYVYLWRGHKLAAKTEISLAELEEYPFITFDQSNDGNFYLAEEAMANHDADKLIKSDDRATSMEMIAELDGYSIGSGMLSEENAILKGLISVKLKEDDPLTIGYITRKRAKLSKYGKAYIEEISKYKEL